MRVLIAVHGFPPTYYAGAERAAERIVNWLVAHDHQVEVFTIEKLDAPSFHVESDIQNGFTVHRLFYNVKVDNRDFQNLYDFSPIGDALKDILSRQSFDLVHLISGYLLGNSVIQTVHDFGLPLVVTLTEYWFMCARLNLVQSTDMLCSGPESDAKCARCLMEEKRRYRLPTQVAPAVANTFWAVAHQLSFDQQGIDAVKERRITLQDALHKANLVISPSRFLIQKFSEFGYDTSRFVHIRHGLNLPTVPKGGKAGENTLRLGYLGQIKGHKGVDLLIDAAMNLLDQGTKLTLDLWGPEDEAPEYAAKLRALTANHPDIRWNGRYAGSEVWSILSNLDAVVVPSRWYENSPTVILEAYNIGLPVIAARLGGMAEMVEHEKSGLLFEFNDAVDLQRQIERLLIEPALLSQITSGVPSVRTASQEVEDIFAQYERLLKS